MARATRSTAQQEKDKPTEPAPPLPPARKAASKKRKRASLTENVDQPATKQPRTDNVEEGSQEPEEQLATTKAVPVGSGDIPIQSSDAERILDVLEMVDTQGLLDRVFPLSAEAADPTPRESSSTPTAPSQAYSFRALLKSSSEYPLRVLRSAVQHLFPISSHPRSRPSAPAAQQLRFCNLALSLLDQASFNSSPISLDVESIIPALTQVDVPSSADAEDTKPTTSPIPAPVHKRKYALMQRLPTGDWFTSINSDVASVEGRELKDLPTAHAELVAVLPAASSSSASQGTLGAYAGRRLVPTIKPALPVSRRVSCGRFLDYGVYATFGPSFDQDGVEVGRDALGEVIWQQEEKQRSRELAKGKRRALREPTEAGDDGDVVMLDGAPDAAGADPMSSSGKQQKPTEPDVDAALEGLLSAEDISALKSALGTLDLEVAVQELLDRNLKALSRLEELQLERLGLEDCASRNVDPESEEWDVASGILDSLALLASLRPRTSSDESPPLIPPSSVLQKLHRTLPIDVTQGWRGTLPEGRTTAVRDDTTIHLKPGVPIPAPATTPAAPVAPATKPIPPTGPAYNGYTYSNYPGGQYRGGYGTYTPQQTSSYYQNYSSSAGQSGGAHYPSQQYSTGPPGYSYSPSWYNYQPAQGTAGSSSGRATPQPTASSPLATNYASFFASQQAPQPQRAVANTVLAATNGKPYQGGWAGQTYAPPPTLPPHLRTAVGGAPGTPGTPQPAGNSYGYYGAYPTTPAAR